MAPTAKTANKIRINALEESMREKRILTKKIAQCKASIEELEQKRSRSQAALITAILSNTTPNDDDVEYFNKFTAEIDAQRDILRGLVAELESL